MSLVKPTIGVVVRLYLSSLVSRNIKWDFLSPRRGTSAMHRGLTSSSSKFALAFAKRFVEVQASYYPFH